MRKSQTAAISFRVSSRHWTDGCVFGAHFLKKACCLLALPKQMSFLTISNKKKFFSKLEALDWMRQSHPKKVQNRLCLYFFVWKILYFVRKYICKSSVYTVTFALQFFHVAGYWKCSNKTPTPIQIYISFVATILRPKLLGNRLGIY